MHVLFARPFQPALLVVIAAAVLAFVIAVLLLAGMLGGAGHEHLLVGPFRWELLMSTRLA